MSRMEILTEGHVFQELPAGEEEAGCYEGYLRWTVHVVVGAGRSGVDPDDVLLHVRGGECAGAQPGARGPSHIGWIALAEARGVGREDGHGVRFRRLYLVDVPGVPPLGEAEVRVGLEVVVLPPPQLRGVVPGHGRTKALGLVHVQGADLAGLAVPPEVRVAAELLHPVLVGGGVGHLGHVAAVPVLAHHLCARPAGVLISEAVLHDGADVDFVGMFRVAEGVLEGRTEEMVPERRQAHEDGPILPNREDVPAAVGLVEGD